MKKFILLAAISACNCVCIKAQDTYTMDFDTLPNYLLHKGELKDPYNGVPEIKNSNGSLLFQTTNDPGNYFQGSFTFWVIRFQNSDTLDLSGRFGTEPNNNMLPTIKVKMKSTENCYVYLTLAGYHHLQYFGNNTDYYMGRLNSDTWRNNHFEIPGDAQWHEYVYNFENQFYDRFGSMIGASLGPVDSTSIFGIRISINRGWGEPWAYKNGILSSGDNNWYDTPFGYGFDGSGTGASLWIDDLVIGKPVSNIPNPFITVSDDMLVFGDTLVTKLHGGVTNDYQLEYKEGANTEWSKLDSAFNENERSWIASGFEVGVYELRAVNDEDTTKAVEFRVIEPVSVFEELALRGVQVYPNPAKDKLSFDQQLTEGLTSISVYDLSGKLIYTDNYPKNHTSILRHLNLVFTRCSSYMIMRFGEKSL